MKKLLFTLAVAFACSTLTFALKPVEVVKKYMDNDTLGFHYTNYLASDGSRNTTFNPEDVLKTTPAVNVTVKNLDGTTGTVSMPRYHKIGVPWVTEGDLGTMGTDATCWHVDMQKGTSALKKGTLTLTSGWGDFAHTFDNMKVYQKTKVAVPAGKYDFKASQGQDWTGAKYTFLVVTKGTTIPDTTTLVAKSDPNVLGFVRLDTSKTVSFTLAANANLTVGLVACFPAHANESQGYCVALGSFSFVAWVAGTDYSNLKTLLTQAKALAADQYPIGTTAGTYPQANWDAMVSSRNAAQAIVDAIVPGNPIDNPGYQDAHTQTQVDAAYNALKTAIDNLKKSMLMPFQYSTATKEYYYRIHDKRTPASYMFIGETIVGSENISRLLYQKTEPDKTDERFLFKFVKDTKQQGNVFFIYNKMHPNKALSVKAGVANVIEVADAGKDTTWVLGRTPNKYQDFFTISLSSANNQLNSYGGQDYIGFYNPNADDSGNDWQFLYDAPAGATDFNALRTLLGRVSSLTAAQFPIGTGSGQFQQDKWDAFVAARTAATDMLSKEFNDPQPTQASVDASTAQLQSTYDALLMSMVTPIKLSTATETIYYKVHDKRGLAGKDDGLTNYWLYDTENTRLGVVGKAAMTTADPDLYLFRFEKYAGDPSGKSVLIYTKKDPSHALFYELPASGKMGDVVLTAFGGTAASDTTAFVFAKTPAYDADYYTIGLRSAPTWQMNSNREKVLVGFWATITDDAGNDWAFIQEGHDNVKNTTAQELGIYVAGRRILSKDADAKLTVYTTTGQKMNESTTFAPGIYIVTVKGKQGSAKVMVK